MLLINVFQTNNLMLSFLKAEKKNELGTCDSEDDKERRPLHEGLCSL
jgi:hypothetical protein